MAKRAMIDYGVTEDNDLKIGGGDFVREESTRQHQTQLILCGDGEYNENPLSTVAANKYLDDEGKEQLVAEIATKFMLDGMTVKNMKPTPDSITDSTVSPFPNAFYE